MASQGMMRYLLFNKIRDATVGLTIDNNYARAFTVPEWTVIDHKDH